MDNVTTIINNNQWIVSVLIPAFVSLIIAYFTSRFNNNKLYADLVAENRIKSDVSKTMRKLIEQVFRTKSLKELKELVPKVKMCINPYSYVLSMKNNPEEIDYMHDEHIWRLLFEIEKAKESKKLKFYKECLGMYISMWLKYDWKRHHYEVQKKSIKEIEVEYIKKLKEFENQVPVGVKK